MKKKYFTIIILFISILVTQAQFTVATHDGDPITDSSVFTFSDIGTLADANGVDLTFDITNTSTGTIDMRLEYVSMNNGDGTGTMLCIFGTCLPPGGITPGTIYGGPDTTIPAGQTSTTDNHFWNTDAGDGVNYPIEYVFRLLEVDVNGNEIGDSITFTYSYDGTASLEDRTQVNFKLYPSVTNDFVNLVVNESVTARLINTQGQLIKQFQFESGNHTIDVSTFSKQLYYLLISNKQGQQSLAKIVIK